MTTTELVEVLRLHALWLINTKEGVRANLSGANLRGADLRYSNLSGADLRDSNLSGADLRDSNLRYSNLRGADLRYANLSGADLRYANLSGADLRYANLSGADLRGANLSGADLRGSDLGMATPEEIARLDAVREILLVTPERLNMSTWHSDWWDASHTPEEEHACGSAHCIAGWLQALSPDPAIRKLDPEAAGTLLAPIAAPLFYADDDTVLQWFKDRGYANQVTA